MSWVLLVLAGLLEVVWAIGLKYSAGFTRPFPSAVTVLAMLASFLLLSRAMHQLPLGTAYAVWTGIGVVGTTLAGIGLFGEPLTLARGICVLLVIAGMLGLRLLPAG
jgi:quaternary ammonium compound-resistance protein SugE